MSKYDWSTLPIDLLELIAERLNVNHVIRLRAVCKSWQKISPSSKLHSTQVPWLMLPFKKSIHTRRRFYSLSDSNHIYSIKLSQYNQNSCCGSSRGWLFEVDNLMRCSILNPLTRVHIVLPSVWLANSNYLGGSPRTHHQIIDKFVLSSSPLTSKYSSDNDTCLVMIILENRRKLAFCKSVDKTWTIIEENMCTVGLYEDVTYFKGQFYAVDDKGRVVVCDLSGPWPVINEVKTQECDNACKYYLVESSGELLLIRRFRSWTASNHNTTVCFEVLRQDPICKKWIQVETLHNNAIFLGYNHSFDLLASKISGCKGNCIYFADESYHLNRNGGRDHVIGIFNLADGLFEPFSDSFWKLGFQNTDAMCLDYVN
ncbi:hypothetical protein AQUCO_00700842v1 [Aquilegia coerulea]|uniref:F-box domain-containing protein n=1 Tax=Aquilegia coerulea TaxID=218851 RepID=A0A2G5ELV3_AQUCA|nr:hypothetical protein AQUCO_00700842v1 [Aquilegia coerulea]